jgi:CBS domain-containing protein
MTRAIDVMTERPVTVSAEASVTTAARILDELEIRHLPVIDDAGELVGMLSDRDVRGSLGASGDGALEASARVGDLMTGNVIEALPDDDLADVAELMVDYRIGAVPIVDARRTLVGIVSYVDVLRSIIAERR